MYMLIIGSRLKIHYDSVICNLSFCLVGPSISPVWGNVDPRFDKTLDMVELILNLMNLLIYLYACCWLMSQNSL